MRIVIIGGGASGMLASSMISKNNKVILVEKNEKLGKKLYITGKGRCNVTNDCTPREFLENVVTNAKFMQSAIYGFTSEDTMAFLEENGLSLVLERGNRVFPKSNKSSDVIKTLSNALLKNGVEVRLNTVVESVKKTGDTFIVATSNGDIECDAVVVATGGVSYPLTGSTGDGYKFAKSFSHDIVRPKASLCPIRVAEQNIAKELEGLSLKNVDVSVIKDGKKIVGEFGEMIFTAFGVSGPTILSISANINKIDLNNTKISIDLKPALTYEELDKRVLSDFKLFSNKEFKNALSDLLPKKLIPVVVRLSG
ncbi:MAG: aminoacetone oxidase family FAD-binding enzyme, partial [Eubacteriales bacterium]|nr:aminoacetone oxidase family FAD-binding enzyme [Eubacteriales bacterium]